MMPRLVLTFALSLPLIACGGSDGGETPTPGSDDAYAAELYSSFADGQYEGWSTVPAEGAELSVSGDHSGNYVITYANGTAADALADWSGTMPDGGLLLKVQYSDEAGTELAGYTVMEKVEGFNPEGGDWFWAGYQADGTTYAAGAASGCIGCHSAGGEDYIRTEF